VVRIGLIPIARNFTLAVLLVPQPILIDGGQAAGQRASGRRFGSLFGLAPGGVFRAGCVAATAVRSYRTFSPLPSRSLGIRRFIFCGTFPRPDKVNSPGRVGVTHHRALWCSDFPPGFRRATARPFHTKIITLLANVSKADLDISFRAGFIITFVIT